MSIGSKIKSLRQYHGITQKELAERIHKSPQVISNWERGYTPNIANDDVVSLATALSVSVSDILADSNDKFAQKTTRQNADRPAAKKLKQELQLDAQDMELIKAFVQLSPEQRKKGVDFIKALSSNVVDIMPSAQTAAAPPDTGRPDGLTDEEWNIVQMLRLEEEESSASLSSVSAKRA